MSAPAIPAARAADPGAGATAQVARRTPDKAADTFGALLASHGPAPVRVRTAEGRPPARPEVDSAQTGRGPQAGRSPHRGVTPRGRSVSTARDDAAEPDRTEAATPSTTATPSAADAAAQRTPDAAPGVVGAADAATAATGTAATAAAATGTAAAATGTAATAATTATPDGGLHAVPAAKPGAAPLPATLTDLPTGQRIPATAGAGGVTAAAVTAPVATDDPVAAPAAGTAPVVTAALVASGTRHTAARDGDPVTPASTDTAPGPALAAAPFALPVTVVTSPTAGPTPSAPPVPAAPVPAQVLAAVSPLLRGDDGSYAVQLQLHPHDLGAVQVTVDVRHGEISVQLHTPDAAAQDALRDGLADLRRQLEEQGLRTGSMEVGSGGPHQHREDTRRQPVGMVVRGTSTVAARPGPAAGGATTALDLRM